MPSRQITNIGRTCMVILVGLCCARVTLLLRLPPHLGPIVQAVIETLTGAPVSGFFLLLFLVMLVASIMYW